MSSRVGVHGKGYTAIRNRIFTLRCQLDEIELKLDHEPKVSELTPMIDRIDSMSNDLYKAVKAAQKSRKMPY